MPPTFDSFRAIIGLWPSPVAMAGEIGADVHAARKWAQRDKIPDDWWAALLEAPRVKDAGITAELLVSLAAREPAGASG